MHKASDKRKTVTTACIVIVGIAILAILIYFAGDGSDIENQKTITPEPTKTETSYTKPELKPDYDTEEGLAYIYSDKLGNAADNTYIIKYKVIDKTDMNVIYESAYISPGTEMTCLKFPYEAEAGEYDVFLQILSYDPVTMDEKNGVIYSLKLNVR